MSRHLRGSTATRAQRRVGHTTSERRVRAELSARLSNRLGEIEQTALTRVYSVSDPTRPRDPGYLEGLRSAIAAALEYGLASIASSERNPPQIPPVLLVQARVAARNGVSLDTVLRRYFAGYALLGDFTLEEAEREGIDGTELRHLLRGQAASFDRLLTAVSEEHGRESKDRPETAEARRARLVRRLLAGERLDTSEFSYDFDAHHLGAVAAGPGAEQALRELSSSFDARFLIVHLDDATVWVWLCARHRLDPTELAQLVSSRWPAQVSLAIGESAKCLAGWCLTHRQAKAALPIALRGAEPVVRYADVALLASALQDDVLLASIRQLYLQPLEQGRDKGRVARETLQAYFEKDRSIASAAVVLGISRQAVHRRLRTIEDMLGRRLSACSAELETVLNIEELGPPR